MIVIPKSFQSPNHTTMTSIVDKLLIPKHLKKTTKYTDKQRATVQKWYTQGKGIREIARELPMSRRMVQFTLFPERLTLAKKNFATRQKDGRYRLTTKEQTAQVKAVRDRKKLIINQLIPNGTHKRTTIGNAI